MEKQQTCYDHSSWGAGQVVTDVVKFTDTLGVIQKQKQSLQGTFFQCLHMLIQEDPLAKGNVFRKVKP